MKLYVLTKDLEIGYIDHICICDECRKRGNVELTILYLDGSFMLQTTLDELMQKEEIVLISKSKDEVIYAKSIISKSDYYLCKYLENELFKTD